MNQLIVAESEESTAQVRLGAALFRPPNTPIQVPSDLDLRESVVTASGIDELALSNRPELQGAEEEITRGEKKYELADRNRKFPDFMLGWDYMRMPTDMKKDRYGLMVNMTIPFSPWTMGKRNYEVEETLAEIRAAKLNREAMRNITLKQVGELQAKAQAGLQSLRLYREGLLAQAELSFRSAMAAYQTGRAEFVNLLEAERALLEVRMGYYKSQVNLVQLLADLERVVGKELR
jgi:outer membrane protein TolC